MLLVAGLLVVSPVRWSLGMGTVCVGGIGRGGVRPVTVLG